MSQFKFNLETILNYRRNLEEREKEFFAKALQKVQAEENFMQQLNQEKRSYLHARDSYGTKLTDMRQKEAYLSLLDSRIENQRVELDKSMQHLKKRRLSLTQAVSKRLVLEHLKEKGLEEHLGELSRVEQKLLDEVGISAFSRQDGNYLRTAERR